MYVSRSTPFFTSSHRDTTAPTREREISPFPTDEKIAEKESGAKNMETMMYMEHQGVQTKKELEDLYKRLGAEQLVKGTAKTDSFGKTGSKGQN